MQCEQFALTTTGLWRLSLIPFLEGLASEARGHARKFGGKVVSLGGVPATGVSPVRAGGTAEEVVREVLRLEKTALQTYAHALDLVPHHDGALRTMVEDHIESEQRHIEEIAKLVGADAQAKSEDVRRVS